MLRCHKIFLPSVFSFLFLPPLLSLSSCLLFPILVLLFYSPNFFFFFFFFFFPFSLLLFPTHFICFISYDTSSAFFLSSFTVFFFSFSPLSSCPLSQFASFLFTFPLFPHFTLFKKSSSLSLSDLPSYFPIPYVLHASSTSFFPFLLIFVLLFFLLSVSSIQLPSRYFLSKCRTPTEISAGMLSHRVDRPCRDCWQLLGSVYHLTCSYQYHFLSCNVERILKSLQI